MQQATITISESQVKKLKDFHLPSDLVTAETDFFLFTHLTHPSSWATPGSLTAVTHLDSRHGQNDEIVRNMSYLFAIPISIQAKLTPLGFCNRFYG